MRYAALSDVGRVRDRNEDFFHADGRLFVVADGMGGHRAGEVASLAAVEEFLRCERENRGADPLRRLRCCLQAANRVVLKMAEGDPELRGMGTTFTVLLLENGAYLGHVGDSRAYLLREGGLNPLTRDHSLVEKMVREGFLTPREARRHPRRNVILRALGLSVNLAADLVRVDVRPGDRILLCTDGLTSQLDGRRVGPPAPGRGPGGVRPEAYRGGQRKGR
jgi:protein phosphatase